MQLLGQGQETGKKIKHYTYNYADLVGRGNFSRVYKGINTKTQQIVAIKIVSLDALKSKHLQELVYEQIKILQQMDHPNILKFHEALLSDRNCYIVTEFCEGGNLEDRILTKKPFSDQELANIIFDVYQGLRYLRQMKVCHRDLKTANIFFSGGKAKIADFGLAKLYNEQFKDLDIGSPLYMSPEGLIYNVYGQKTDLWAFGIVIYQMLHGITPFLDCKTEMDLKTAVQRPLPEQKFRSNISLELRQLINCLLTVDERYRPSVYDLSCNQFISNLMSCKNYQKNQGSHKFNQTVKINDENENVSRDKQLGIHRLGAEKKLNVYSQAGFPKMIELGGSKSSQGNTYQQPKNHYSHLKGSKNFGILPPAYNPNNTSQRINSSKTIDTKASQDDFFFKRKGNRMQPTLMK